MPTAPENLRLACEAINGTILNPGEVFSFNDVVGERTAEKGYKPATIYADGGASVDDLGGGVLSGGLYHLLYHPLYGPGAGPAGPPYVSGDLRA